MNEKDVLNGEHANCHECGDFKQELIVHFPYAVCSVAFALIGAAILSYFTFGATPEVVQKGTHALFHTFHFVHIVFAATGALLTYFRFSKNLIGGLIVATLSTAVFCVLSDVLMPYIGGSILGVKMCLHICFISRFYKVAPFLFVGLINGWVLSQHKKGLQSHYSIWSHFTHIFISSVASLLYLISHGFHNWQSSIGGVFLILILAVVIPCTLSDVVVPMFFARLTEKK